MKAEILEIFEVLTFFENFEILNIKFKFEKKIRLCRRKFLQHFV
jgi:hypothetical protein